MKIKRKYNWWLAVLPESFSGTSWANLKIITNKYRIGDITDTKQPTWSDVPVAGLNYTPFDFVRNGNTSISFSVPIIDKSTMFGNADQMAALESLRNIEYDISSITPKLFAKNPLCIYSGYGTHRPPLPVIVKECKFNHKSEGFSHPKTGIIQFTTVDFTLEYVENSSWYRGYQKLSQLAGIVGSLRQLTGVV